MNSNSIFKFKLSNAYTESDQRQKNYHSVENACSNKDVFSLRLKMLESGISWIAWGRLFQALGPAWENNVLQTSAELSVVHNGESWQIWDGFLKGLPKVSSYNKNTCTGTFTTLISCASSMTRNWWPKVSSMTLCFASSHAAYPTTTNSIIWRYEFCPIYLLIHF